MFMMARGGWNKGWKNHTWVNGMRVMVDKSRCVGFRVSILNNVQSIETNLLRDMGLLPNNWPTGKGYNGGLLLG